MRVWQRSTCQSRGLECDMTLEYRALYTSPDSKVFEVRRCRCPRCGNRTLSAQRRTASPPNPTWTGDGDVQANF